MFGLSKDWSSNTARPPLPALRPRLGPTSDLVKQIERLTYIDRFAAEDRELALKVRAAWAPSLAALRSDAEAQLPE